MIRRLQVAAGVLVALALVAYYAPGPFLLAVVVAAAVWRWRHHGAARHVGCASTSARLVAGRLVAEHEVGHYTVGRAIGMTGVTARTTLFGGGICTGRGKLSPVDAIAFLRAGEYAVHSGAGCSYDRAQVRVILADLPPDERRATLRAGEDKARAILRRSDMRDDVATFRETGRVG